MKNRKPKHRPEPSVYEADVTWNEAIEAAAKVAMRGGYDLLAARIRRLKRAS